MVAKGTVGDCPQHSNCVDNVFFGDVFFAVLYWKQFGRTEEFCSQWKAIKWCDKVSAPHPLRRGNV